MRDFLGRDGGAAYPETVSLYAPNPSPFSGSPAGLAAMDERARDIFRRIVETYLETGDPVGSRTLSQTGIALSPASIRNTMQDLAMAGLLGAPHTSAGRIPTHAGLRLFVDGLLEIGDLGTEERREIDARLAGRGRSFDEALNEASSLLSGLAGGASIVASPVREAGVKHVEFVALGHDQALAVLVGDMAGVLHCVDVVSGERVGELRVAGGIEGVPCYGDLDGDGRIELVVTTTAGQVHAWRFARGSLWPSACHPGMSRYSGHLTLE
jgi:hypothetical protein